MDILDVNDTCKRPISLQKHLYLICQAKLFRDPKLHSSAPNGVATHSLRSPVVSDVSSRCAYNRYVYCFIINL